MSILRPQNVTFSAAGDPTQSIVGARVSDLYHNTTSGEVLRCKVDTLGSQEWVGDQGSLVPAAILATDHPNLVAMYTMDNISGSTLNDESTNANNATITGAVVASAGQIGNALDFAAATSEADSVAIPVLSLGTSWAISAWVLAPTPTTTQRPALTNSWPNADSLPANPNYRLGLITLSTLSGSNIVVNCGLDNTWRDTGAPANGAFQHIVISYDGTTCKVYANGVETLSYTTEVSLDREGAMGAYNLTDSGNFWFLGKHDQQRYFNRPVTQAEVTALYNEGNP